MTNVRWTMIVLCFAGMTINYIDRANLGVAAHAIGHDLHLGPATVGLILSGFFWTYAASQIPMGWLIDRFGPARVYPIAAGWWSVFSASCGLGTSAATLTASRLLMGVGEASSLPTSAKVVSLWFPTKERAFASCIWDAGARVGLFVAFPIVATLVAAYGWRVSFYGTGALGLIFAVVWFFVYRDPAKSRANEAELAYIREGRSVAEDLALRPPTIGELFRYRTTWGLMIGFFCSNILNYFFITWYPSYLVEARHFSLSSVATIGAIPPLVAIAGGLLGGFTADRLFRSGWSLTRARKTCLVGGMLVSSVIVVAAIVPNIGVSIALFSLSYGAVAFAAANINGLAPEIAPTRRHVALLQGIQTFGGNIAGIVTSTFTGVMVALTSGSYVIPMAVTAGFAIVGALVYAFVVGPIAPLQLPDERIAPTVATAT